METGFLSNSCYAFPAGAQSDKLKMENDRKRKVKNSVAIHRFVNQILKAKDWKEINSDSEEKMLNSVQTLLSDSLLLCLICFGWAVVNVNIGSLFSSISCLLCQHGHFVPWELFIL